MGVVNYYVTDGEILGDSHAGDYMRDALGSVTGTTSPTDATVQSTYRYKPYGTELVSSGASQTPKFKWVGTYGYRQTSISRSASYVRARHYGQEEGKWTTVDPLSPKEANYGYEQSKPCTVTDESGLACSKDLKEEIGYGITCGKPPFVNCCGQRPGWCNCSATVKVTTSYYIEVPSKSEILDRYYGLPCTERGTTTCVVDESANKKCSPPTFCREQLSSCKCSGSSFLARIDYFWVTPIHEVSTKVCSFIMLERAWNGTTSRLGCDIRCSP